MNILIGTVALWIAAVWLWRHLPRDKRPEAIDRVRSTLAFILPRVLFALVGAGLIAELLPAERIEDLFGETSGLVGVLVAALLGPVTPGGAFVSFALASAAISAGASLAPVIAYITAWSLFSITRTLAYEVPILGSRPVLLRIAVSWPVPALLGTVALSLGFGLGPR